MFKIYDGRNEFYQWDLDRKLIVEDSSINQVHFCNRLGNTSIIRYVYEVNGMYLVDVPNLLLQEAFKMNVYGYDKNYTKHSEQFKIVARTRPENYVYTEEEVKTWSELEQRIVEIEEEGISPEVIENKINEYMEANPIKPGATEAEAAQIETNKNDIAEIKADYATETYVDEAVAAIEVPETDLSDYATKTYVDEALKDADIEVDLTDYYTKTETDSAINAAKPDLTEYATTDYVDAKVSGIPIVDVNQMATKSYVTTQIGNRFATEMPNYYTKTEADKAVSDYVAGELEAYETKEYAEARWNTINSELDGKATKDDIDEAIAEAQLGGSGQEVDLSQYLKIDDAQTIYLTRSAAMGTYYTKTETENLIDNKLAAIGVAEEGAY